MFRYSPAALVFSFLLYAAAWAQPVQRPVENTGRGFFVKDGRIYDPAGVEFIPMGYNSSVYWGDEVDCKRENMSEHIAASGANAVRIVTQIEGSFGWNADPTEQRNLVDRAVRAQLVPMLEMHNATCDRDRMRQIVDYWTSDEMVALCRDYEENLWVNIANEHNF
ncbi:MAG: cellulase family glycosylhydrolase, partial [Catalinimonas sp.]